MLVTAFLVLCLHISLSWFFIFHLGLGNSDAFLAVGQLFHYATPSALMVCLKWWSFEVLTLLSELLPNPKLETSVLSICLTISSLHFVIPFGLGVGASTRVSNELGSGNPQKALVAVRVAMFLAVIETVVVSTVTFLCRGVLGKAYSNDEQVVDYVAAIAPFLCLSFITDSLQAVISGIARGSGWQIIGAYVNLGAFYLVGIPVASLLCFVVNLKAKGLWIGLLVGSAIQATSFSLILVFTDWQKQAIKAKKRVSEKKSSEENNKRGLIK
ncbi:hypothetical protein KY289_015750 [Solanum tuberosum]|nr:hypothetical protein KY289_015750 [Solanum tuberosum]